METLQSTLASLDRILKAPEVMQTVAELPQLVLQLRRTLETVDGEVAGLSGSVRETLAGSAGSLQKTLDGVQRLAATLEREAASTASAARGTLQKADTTLAGVNTAVGAVPATLEATNRTLEGGSTERSIRTDARWSSSSAQSTTWRLPQRACAASPSAPSAIRPYSSGDGDDLHSHCCHAILALTMLSACASSPPALLRCPRPGRCRILPCGRMPALRCCCGGLPCPGYLDGFPVVTGRDGQRLIVTSGVEWGERLSDAAARVLRDALSQRLGASRVLIEGDGRVPDADLSIEFLALEPSANGRLALDARWSFVASAGARSHAGRTQLQVPLAAQDASGVAAATAQALGSSPTRSHVKQNHSCPRRRPRGRSEERRDGGDDMSEVRVHSVWFTLANLARFVFWLLLVGIVLMMFYGRSIDLNSRARRCCSSSRMSASHG